ncbi:MAG: hypothetical protein AAF085_11410, partial [Planctomycetota bacterium]
MKRITMLLTRIQALVIVLAVFVNLPTLAKQWHVDPDGKTNASGTASDPFATLEQAQMAIRAYRKSAEQTNEAHTVVLHEGRYAIDRTLVLDKSDGGTGTAPVIYRTKAGARVTVHGGMEVETSQFRALSDIEASRLPAVSREHVVVAQLDDQSVIKALGRGQGRYGTLVSNEHTLQLARWPNRGFAHLDEVIEMGPTLRWLTDGQKPPAYSYEDPIGGRFTLLEEPKFDAWRNELQRTRDIRQGGYLSNDWTEDKNQVARISDDGVIQLLDATRYGIGGVKYRGGFANPNDEPRFLKHR